MGCHGVRHSRPDTKHIGRRRKILLSRHDARRLDYGGLGKIMGEFAIGQSVLRREDPRLLRGHGRFFDDLKLAYQLHAAIVRSPYAHADITDIDTRAALQMPGVHAVLTGEDYAPMASARSLTPSKGRLIRCTVPGLNSEPFGDLAYAISYRPGPDP